MERERRRGAPQGGAHGQGQALGGWRVRTDGRKLEGFLEVSPALGRTTLCLLPFVSHKEIKAKELDLELRQPSSRQLLLPHPQTTHSTLISFPFTCSDTPFTPDMHVFHWSRPSRCENHPFSYWCVCVCVSAYILNTHFPHCPWHYIWQLTRA